MSLKLHDRLKKLYPMNEVCRLIDAHFARIDGLEERVLSIHPRVDAAERGVGDLAASVSALLQGMACLVQQMQQHQRIHQESDQKHDRDYGLHRHMASAIESFNTSLVDLDKHISGIYTKIEASEQGVGDIAANGSALLEGMTCLLQQVPQQQRTIEESEQKRQESEQKRQREDARNRSTLELLNSFLLDAASQSRERVQLTGALEQFVTTFRGLNSRISGGHDTLDTRHDNQSTAESGTLQELACLERSVGIAGFGREIEQRHSSEVQPIHERQTLAESGALQELATLRKQCADLAGFVQELDQRQSNQMQQILQCLSDSSATTAALTLAAESQEIGSFLGALPRGPIVMKTSQPELWNPEGALLVHLAPLLRNQTALDIGAGNGALSGRLLAAGYEVFAFEPFPRAFANLQGRLGNDGRFHGYQLAVGYSDGVTELHVAEDRSSTSKYGDVTPFNSLLPHSMPGDLKFNGTIDVRLRSLDSLVRANLVPSDLGVIAIDTEGYDLEVMRGMSSCSCQVLMAEFWDPKMVFGKSGSLNRLSDMVREVSPRGYRWHIVVYRLDSRPVSYYCNQSESVAGSWGNVVFFRDRTIFDEALKWCSTVMAPTYFAGEAPANEAFQARAMKA